MAGNCGFVARTPKNTHTGQVMEQDPALEVGRRGVQLRIAHHPGARQRFRVWSVNVPVNVRRHEIIVIVDVHQPSFLELSEIADARDRLPLELGLG
jgi:hypothetical protein